MRASLRTAAWLYFSATLLAALALGLFAAWLFNEVVPPGTVITIDGERFVVPSPSPHPGHWLVALTALMAVAALLVLVLPLLVGLALLVPLLVSSLALALPLAPLALLVWALTLWLRRRRREPARSIDERPATIAP
jgi:hypothetical protein